MMAGSKIRVLIAKPGLDGHDRGVHYLEEAQQLCDRIAIINHGRVILCEETETILARIDQKDLTISLGEELAAVPDALAGYDVTQLGPKQIAIRYRPSETRIRDILQAVREQGLNIVDLTTTEGDLEDVFLALTREPPAEDGEG